MKTLSPVLSEVCDWGVGELTCWWLPPFHVMTVVGSRSQTEMECAAAYDRDAVCDDDCEACQGGETPKYCPATTRQIS